MALVNDEPTKPLTSAERLRKMADAIDHNAASGFGGAFVIIPPENGGNPIETLILDSKQDPAQFWILLKSKCDTEIAMLDASLRQGRR